MPQALPWAIGPPAGWDVHPLWSLVTESRESPTDADPLLSGFIDGSVVRRDDRPGAVIKSSGMEAGYKRIQEGAIAVSGMNAHLGAIGVAQTTGRMSPVYVVLEPGPDIEPRFLSHQLRHLGLSGWLMTLSKSIRFNSTDLSFEKIREVPVAFPRLEEQRAIANFLERETTRIDALIRKKRLMIQKVGERWRTLVRTRAKQLQDQFGSIPLKRVVTCLDGRRIPLSGEEREGRRGPFPYYGASGVIDHIDGWLFDEVLVLLGEDGAQLGDPDYEISFVVREKCWVNNHAHVLRPAGADPDFLALHLSTFDRFSFMSGATREKITQEDMDGIPVPDIDLERQALEASLLLSERERASLLELRLREQVKLLQEHRQALITAAVTGQMEIRAAA